ncbi:hypothetical protein D3C75_1072540 [compost metagenome]
MMECGLNICREQHPYTVIFCHIVDCRLNLHSFAFAFQRDYCAKLQNDGITAALSLAFRVIHQRKLFLLEQTVCRGWNLPGMSDLD